jgi:adenine-specific DNA-methyltransferase
MDQPYANLAFLAATATRKDALVVDFFAGSSTTAHAVMKLNADDGGNRRFIMVQAPQSCDADSVPARAGFRTIADISKERIRRAGTALLGEAEASTWRRDVGFRVLKVDSSNMNDVYYTPNTLTQAQLSLAADNVKPDRTAEDLLFQVLVDWGVDLSLPIERREVLGFTVFLVDGNALAACFDKSVDEPLIRELATHRPLRAVFRDGGYASDSTKINVEQIFKLISPETEVRSL